MSNGDLKITGLCRVPCFLGVGASGRLDVYTQGSRKVTAETTPKHLRNAGSIGKIGASIQDHNAAVGTSSRAFVGWRGRQCFASVSECKFQKILGSQTAKKLGITLWPRADSDRQYGDFSESGDESSGDSRSVNHHLVRAPDGTLRPPGNRAAHLTCWQRITKAQG